MISTDYDIMLIRWPGRFECVDCIEASNLARRVGGILIFEVDQLEDIGDLPISHEEHLNLLTALAWAELWGSSAVAMPVFYRAVSRDIIQGVDVKDWLIKALSEG